MENIVEGTVISNTDCIADIDVQGQIVQGVSACQIGGTVNVFIRPEDITLSLKPSTSARNVFPGQIRNDDSQRAAGTSYTGLWVFL